MDIRGDLNPRREWGTRTWDGDGDGNGGKILNGNEGWGACPRPIGTHCHP